MNLSATLLARSTWRLALGAGWGVVSLIGSTTLLAVSHLGAGVMLGPLRKGTIEQAQNAGLVAVIGLLGCLTAMLVLTVYAPALRAHAKRLAFLNAALFFSGLPCAMLALAMTNWFGGDDFRGWTSFTGLVGFVLWVRALTEGLRGMRAVVQG